MATQGQTIDPKTGKIYRVQPPKERSPKFLELSANAEAARIALVNYCNDKGYVYDLKTSRTVMVREINGSAQSRPVSKDLELETLIKRQRDAKSAVKEYKSTHREEFTPQKPGKASKRRNTPTMGVINRPEQA
jgi:hypothetical protein